MLPLILPLPGNELLAAALARELPAEVGMLTVRQFPDGETYARIETAVENRVVLLACTLHRPDDKLLPLVFAAETARELRARQVGLVAPYLAYMRQDRRFQPGEAVTSLYFAKLLSRAVDWIVTVDPHLHRHTNLGEIYSIPTAVMHASSLLSGWIAERVQRPVLVGPDAESAQWVEAVASAAGAPAVVLEKARHGDRDVDIRVPEMDRWRDHTPVLVDDIISTARTMIETTRHLRKAGLAGPVCLAVHPVFSPGAYEELLRNGAREVVTCNTIPHSSNRLDVSKLLVTGLTDLLAGVAPP
jgi:ribose-phosphate pyrophosphokinase